VEHWVRGKTLGGSSAVNGLVYNRGQRADYDALERLGNPGWGWDEMLPAFLEIEDHALGASNVRGAGGPLHVSTVDGTDPLLEDAITAGTRLGWRRMRDLNENDEQRIGYAMATIRDGRRVSAADAFLHPIVDRPNLTVALQSAVDRVVLEGLRAVGVSGRGVDVRATREVIPATGSIATPRILQLSGIGPADALRAAGVDAVVDSPNVGARLREHLAFSLQFRLAQDLGYNAPLASGAAEAEYRRARRGPLAGPSFDIIAFFKTRPQLERPDAQIQIAPFSMLPLEPGRPLELEREPGMICVGYLLRPDSEGAVRITSPDPAAPLDIEPNYFATEHDRAVAVDVFRAMRRLFATDPLARRIERETIPGPEVQSDGEIVDAGLMTGGCGYHALGTCAMGADDADVVDSAAGPRGGEPARRGRVGVADHGRRQPQRAGLCAGLASRRLHPRRRRWQRMTPMDPADQPVTKAGWGETTHRFARHGGDGCRCPPAARC
jgi:choline dehydrogenase-like flavoprotein